MRCIVQRGEAKRGSQQTMRKTTAAVLRQIISIRLQLKADSQRIGPVSAELRTVMQQAANRGNLEGLRAIAAVWEFCGGRLDQHSADATLRLVKTILGTING